MFPRHSAARPRPSSYPYQPYRPDRRAMAVQTPARACPATVTGSRWDRATARAERTRPAKRKMQLAENNATSAGLPRGACRHAGGGILARDSIAAVTDRDQTANRHNDATQPNQPNQ